MSRTVYSVLISAAVLGTPALTFAGSFSWFDEQPERDSLGQIKPPSALFDRDQRLTFGIDAYRSLKSDVDASPAVPAPDAVTVYGEFSADSDIYAPLAAINRGASTASPLLEDQASRLTGFGVKWRHHLDAGNSFSVAAGYSETPAPTSTTLGQDMLDTRASLSWTSTWEGDLRPGLTGSVFFGDQNPRDDVYEKLGRRYYGFSVGGQMQLGQEHTPYFSYRMQRQYYSGEDLNLPALPYEQRSQVAAGWIWQVQPNWSFQAEASYGLNGATLDPYTQDRGRIFFGTRFDFR